MLPSPVMFFVEAIMKQIESAAAARIARTNPNRTSKLDRGIGSPRHSRVGGDTKCHRKMIVPPFRELFSGWITKAFRRKKIIVIRNINLSCQPPLSEIIQTIGRVRFFSCTIERRQQKSRQYADSGNHHHQ